MIESVNLFVVIAVLVLTLTGWSSGGFIGGAVGLVLGALLLVFPWRGQPLRFWLKLYARRRRPVTLVDPVTVVNDRSAGGVRYQDGVAATAIRILGKRLQPTYFTNATTSMTADTIDVNDLLPEMAQYLGLRLDSISIVSCGARRLVTGDYARVYDTIIGTPPYGGQRETWLVIRVCALDNGDALRARSTLGTASLAVAQRIAMRLRCRGIRARVATTTEILELDRRLGVSALESHNCRWHTVRSDGGWQTTYAYHGADLTTESLARAWSLRADSIIQSVTLFPDGRVSATVTVRTAQPPTAPPALALQSLPGEQALSFAGNLCGPRPSLRGVGRAPLQSSLLLPVGTSGILMGAIAGGDRLLLPLVDPADQIRVHIAADDAIAKRLIIRTAGSGERITVHTTNRGRWDSIRMPHIVVTDQSRPVPGTTVSVIDGTVAPVPRPATVMSVGVARAAIHPAADVLIIQTGRDTIEISSGGERYDVQVEFFRAENRYLSWTVPARGAELELVR